jgi:DNA-binding transcriptional MerR regulator
MEQFFSIGEVAKRANLSVQTLRHYHKLGLLSPSHVSEAGYRFYSAPDCTRLELIRSLREVGFDLATIGLLLKDKQDPKAAVLMQLETLAMQERALKRQRLLLGIVARGDEQAILPRLQRLNVLADLSKLEREDFLAKQLGWNRAADTPQENKEVWEAAILHLPETLNESQLEDWLELAEIASDKTFQQTLERQRQLFDDLSETARLEWSRVLQEAMSQAGQVIEKKDEATSQHVIEVWLEGMGRVFGKPLQPEFLQWLEQQLTATYDPRIGRYWQLVTRLKNLPCSDTYGKAYEWLLAGLRTRVKQQTLVLKNS